MNKNKINVRRFFILETHAINCALNTYKILFLNMWFVILKCRYDQEQSTLNANKVTLMIKGQHKNIYLWI